MAKMSTRAINKHKKNPNVPLMVGGKKGVKFVCSCGCDNFHHVDDDEEYHCNNSKCNCVYDISDDIYKED